MKTALSALVGLGIVVALSGDVPAGQARSTLRPRGTSVSGGMVGGGPKRSTGYFAHRYAYPNGYYYPAYQQPLVVISPYSSPYYLAPTVVVTSPYFCLFHNEGFISRIGLLDHLSGSHKVPLDAAAAICPDATTTCIFPSY